MTQILASHVSIRRVLAATDFSPLSEKALRQALAIACRYHSKFYIVHVVSSWGFNVAGYDAAVEAAKLAQTDLEKLVSELIKSGALKDVEHEIVVAVGDLWEELRRIATGYEIDLIVIGTHGHVGMEKMLMGSVAESVFRYAKRPVLTVGPCVPETESFTSGRRSILFPTDFSTSSVAALPYAISIANEHGAELTLLHVVEKTRDESLFSDMDLMGSLKEKLRKLGPGSLESGTSVQVKVIFGRVVGEVVQFSRDQKSDLIIMGLKAPRFSLRTEDRGYMPLESFRMHAAQFSRSVTWADRTVCFPGSKARISLRRDGSPPKWLTSRFEQWQVSPPRRTKFLPELHGWGCLCYQPTAAMKSLRRPAHYELAFPLGVYLGQMQIKEQATLPSRDIL